MSKTKSKEKEEQEYNLSCFHCRDTFKSKKEVYRNRDGYPLCKDCLYEDLLDYWADPEGLIDKLNSEKFNRDIRKFEKYLDEECIKCDGDHKYFSEFYIEKEWAYEYEGKKYCESCAEDLGLLDDILDESEEGE
jgi:hypothetical protein